MGGTCGKDGECNGCVGQTVHHQIEALAKEITLVLLDLNKQPGKPISLMLNHEGLRPNRIRDRIWGSGDAFPELTLPESWNLVHLKKGGSGLALSIAINGVQSNYDQYGQCFLPEECNPLSLSACTCTCCCDET